MHEIVFNVAAVWLTALVGVCIAAATKAESAAMRVLVVDLLTVVVVGVLVLYSASKRVPYFIDAALVLALVSFAGTLAASRFLGRGRIFE